MKRLLTLVAVVAATFAAVAENIFLYPESANIASPNGFKPYLRPFFLTDRPAAGAVLVCPGGAYRARASDHEGTEIARKFNELGFSAAVLEYRVSPATYPAPQQDVFRAIRILRRKGFTKIAVLGFSAGGHLAASAGTLFDQLTPIVNDEIDRENCRPDALILCYPVISLMPSGHMLSGEKLLGKGNDTDEKRNELSLQNRVTDKTPPAFLWHTATDQTVPYTNSIMFAQELWKRGIPAELHIFPVGKHGKGLAMQLPDAGIWSYLAANFLRQVGNFPR